MQPSVTDINPGVSTLIQLSLERGESKRSANGALYVETGARTGRSPNDKFIVQDATTQDTVDWGKVNRPISPDAFARLWHKAQDYMQKKHAVNFLIAGGFRFTVRGACQGDYRVRLASFIWASSFHSPRREPTCEPSSPRRPGVDSCEFAWSRNKSRTRWGK